MSWKHRRMTRYPAKRPPFRRRRARLTAGEAASMLRDIQLKSGPPSGRASS